MQSLPNKRLTDWNSIEKKEKIPEKMYLFQRKQTVIFREKNYSDVDSFAKKLKMSKAKQ